MYVREDERGNESRCASAEEHYILKNSIHKLSSGKRLVQSRDDAGMLSVQMKMNADSYRDASTMGQIGNAVSFLDMQDDMLSNAQNILTRMSELKGLYINDPMKSEQDTDSYNNEFHNLQKQLYQLSKQTFDGTSLFATTTEMYGGNAVKFRGNESEENTFNISTLNSVAVISIAKLPFLDALNIEREFITESLPASLIGMNSKLMSQYLEFVTDRLLQELDCEKEYNTSNPFDFMDMISLQGKTNFFEKRVSEYQKAGVLNKEEEDTNKYSFDSEF